MSRDRSAALMGRTTALDERSKKRHCRHRCCVVSEASGVSGPREAKDAQDCLNQSRAAKGGEGTSARSAQTKIGAGNGIRTRDFDLGKVALYH
jgi:hypothetical protein